MWLEVSLLDYIFWVVVTALALALLASALLLVKRARGPWKPTVAKPSRRGDPDAALLDTLHLLDAVMEKLWRRLQQLERKRGGNQNPGRGLS